MKKLKSRPAKIMENENLSKNHCKVMTGLIVHTLLTHNATDSQTNVKIFYKYIIRNSDFPGGVGCPTSPKPAGYGSAL